MMCKRYGFPTETKWGYEHTSESVLENDSAKILWDFSIQTDHKLEHNKPDIITVDKQAKEGHIMCGMPIRYSGEIERTREGGTIPRIKKRDRDTLAMQKSDNNSNNHWSFRYNWQRF